MRSLGWFENLWQDVRHGARLLRLSPGFFVVATLSLALGIGANTAIFQLLDAVRLRLLPVKHPEQLVELKIQDNEHCCSGNFSDRRPNFTYPQWDQIRAHQEAFSGTFAWGDEAFNLAAAGEVRYAQGLWISGDYFRTLGVEPYVGRLLSAEDDRPGCGSPGAVISYAFWQREFGGDTHAIGKKLSLSSRPFEVVGVAPPSFSGVEVGKTFDVAVPVCAETWMHGAENHTTKRHHWWLAIMGRLKPGWTVERATAQAQAMSPAVFESTVPPLLRPDDAKWYRLYKLTAMEAGSGVSGLRKQYGEPLWLLLGIAGLVLLIACANLANLMLARASAREREMAVRLAIGADRGRLIRQLLAESLLLAAIGAAIGAFLARFLGEYMVGLISTRDDKLFVDLNADWRVFGFTAAVAVLTCILFGLAPALRATRMAPAAAMKASGRGLTADRNRFGLRRILVVSQVALSLVLVVGALLFARSMRNLLTLDPGFRETGLLVTGVGVDRLNLAPQARAAFHRELLDRVRAIPGVEEAATSSVVPISGNGWNNYIDIVGQKNAARQNTWFTRVSPAYFRTMETPLLAGRDFDQHDTPSSPAVAVVNQEFSRKFLGGANPIGKSLRVQTGVGEPEEVYQIVGFVKNSKYGGLRENFRPIAFVSAAQTREPDNGWNFIVRSSMPLGSLTAALKKAVLDENPGASMRFIVFRTQVRESLLRERLMATLSGFFGVLAVVLATVGLYGVIAYMVARRRGEIGIRIALGADRGNVLRLVLREAALLLTAGLAIGCALTVGLARTANSLLFGLQPSDPATIAGAVTFLALVATAASFIPAWRAARLDPMNALREE
jgi:putative ABC transport system permease protein